MFGSRALRETARRVKKRQAGKGWGPKSGVNDAPKLFASIALFLGCKASFWLLVVWLPNGPDPFLPYIIDLVAGLACLRMLFFAVRRPIMRILLRFQPWANQSSPAIAALWEASLALLQPGNASTAFMERVLPPLPSVGAECALQRYLEALAPVATPTALAAASSCTEEILRAGSHVLDEEMSRCTQGSASDWAWACTWKEVLLHEDAHLLGRCFYLLDRQTLPEGTQNKPAVRAAVLTMRILDFMKRVGNCAIPCRGLMSRAHPVPKIVPRCVRAFDTLFATSIEPAHSGDATLHSRSFQSCSNYIVVLCHGQAIEVPVRDASGARVSEGQLMKLLVSAEAVAKGQNASRKKDPQWGLDTLAWLPWTDWGEVTEGLKIQSSVKFSGDGTEARAIEKIWTAALVLALDSTLPCWPQAQDALSNRALGILLGPSPACRGSGRWRGGAFCLVVQPDGYAGLCCSLPLAEPWAAAQMWEFALSKERYPMSLADAEAEVASPKCIRARPTAKVHGYWENALENFAQAAHRTTLRIVCVKDVGWRQLQRVKIPPAALIHVAAQVAFYKLQGAAAFALDSIPTRLFLGGRSDWVSTTTSLLVGFVEAFCNGIPRTRSAAARKEMRNLLVQACKALDSMQRDTALGNGYYRLLLSMRGSSATGRRHSPLQAILPSQRSSQGVPTVGLCTWLCEVQTDPKTPISALSMGGGGGFCMAGAAARCRISVSPVGDLELNLHVSCTLPKSAPTPSLTKASNATQLDNGHVSDNGMEEFSDCLDEVEDDDEGRNRGTCEREASLQQQTSVARDRVSADSVAREMERTLHDLMDLLQHSA